MSLFNSTKRNLVMTEEHDELYEERKIVLTFDICSSTDILGDLHGTENVQVWRDFLIWIKEYLFEKSRKLKFKLYKFTGDGWIILFNYDFHGILLFDFLEEFCFKFEEKFQHEVAGHLEAPPEIVGLTFGMDRGTLVRFTMKKKIEYVGRAINVACRLQAAIRDKDKKPQYKILMTNPLYQALRDDLEEYRCIKVTRKLRGIAGGKVINCKKIRLLEK